MKHVLIVDDALDLGRLLKTTLNLLDSSMPVVVVPSGEEALLEASRYPLDLLVTDVRLPGMSGLELVEKVRVRHPAAKIIIITGLTDDDILKQVRNIGVDAYFNKPMSIPDFTEAARRCLGMSGMTTTYMGQPETQAAESTNPSEDLSAVMSRLRQSLFAQSVSLIDERGRVIAQAGDTLQKSFEAVWAPAIQETLNASFRVSRLLEEALPRNIVVCQGKSHHLVMAPVEDYSLVIQLEAKKSSLRLAVAFEEAMDAQQELIHHLEKSGMLVRSVQSSQPVMTVSAEPTRGSVPEITPEVNLKQFEALFENQSEKAGQTDPANFWDALESERPIEPIDADVLTYEQARRLGLTPEE